MATRRPNALFLSIVLLLVSSPVFAGGTGEEALGSEERPIIIAVVLRESSPEIKESIEEFLVPIELETGYSIDVSIRRRYSELLDLLRTGKADLALMPPLTFLVASAQGLAEPGFTGEGNPPEVGCRVLARPGFLPESFEEMAGARIVRFDPAAQDGWLSAMLALETYQHGFSHQVNIVDVDSYEEALAALREGRADAGIFPGGPNGTEEADLQVLAEIEDIQGWGIHFHPSVAEEVRRKISNAFIERSGDPPALGFLHELFGWTSIAPAPEDFPLPYEALLRSAGLTSADLP